MLIPEGTPRRASLKQRSSFGRALTSYQKGFISVVVKTEQHVEGSKVRRRKKKAAKGQSRAAFIGSRPLKFPVFLRGRQVEVEAVPVVNTKTHVNYEVTITCQGKVLDWVLTRAERAHIGHAAGMYSEPETSH
jgi:hypothetical protein